ncbi:HDIG domain-containing protein [Clostridium botulinum]|nr:HDIG domain-containing protein [Clostridium botulinum]
MITREEAWNLLTKYNKEAFHIQHALTVEGTMKYFAEKLGYGEEAEFWAMVGLLHDLDFELYPEQHCIKTQEIMREYGLDEKLIRAAASHGYGLCEGELPEPEHQMEKVLFAVDELTGLIGAAARMRPSKSVMDMELSSLKKKFKDKKFAAGCSRDVIKQGANMLDWELDKLLEETILAMRSCEAHINNEMEVYTKN